MVFTCEVFLCLSACAKHHRACQVWLFITEEEISDYETTHTLDICRLCEALVFSPSGMLWFAKCRSVFETLIKLESHSCSRVRSKRDFPDACSLKCTNQLPQVDRPLICSLVPVTEPPLVRKLVYSWDTVWKVVLCLIIESRELWRNVQQASLSEDSSAFHCLGSRFISVNAIARVGMCNNKMTRPYLALWEHALVASPSEGVQRSLLAAERHYAAVAQWEFQFVGFRSVLVLDSWVFLLVNTHLFAHMLAHSVTLSSPLSPLPGWVYETGILCVLLNCTAHSLTVISASYGCFSLQSLS